jgi:hypothetical protein
VTTGRGYMHANTPVAEPLAGPQTPSDVSSANGFNGNRVDYLSGLILAKRKAVKLEREAFLQILAERDTPEQVVADIVAMFTDTAE